MAPQVSLMSLIFFAVPLPRRENNDIIRIRIFPKPTQTKTDPDQNLPRPKHTQTP